jgi:alpha-ketoglutarate-dependent taurine dioxygenase
MDNTTIELVPLSPVGAEVRGLDLREEVPEAIQETLRAAFDERALLLFRDQDLQKDDLLRIAGIFGTVSDQGDAPGGFNYVSNVNKPGFNEKMEWTLVGGGEGELEFHFDHCFQENVLKAILLYGIEIPPAGGDTLFSDVRLATQRLPEKIRERIDGLQIRHKSVFRTGQPEATHPIMFEHPRTGERGLFFSKRHAMEIVGMPAEESAQLLKEFPSYVEDPAIIYRHVWRPRDVVVWDNIALQHAREDFDPKHRRHLQRVQIA